MSISYDPLITDLFESIRVKLAANSTITGIIGSNPLRAYRHHAPKIASYPIIVMNVVGNDRIPGISYDFFINLTIYDKNVNASNRDTLQKEITTIFDDPNSLLEFSQDNTKIDQSEVVSQGIELYDDKDKIYIMPITIKLKARRKNNVV